MSPKTPSESETSESTYPAAEPVAGSPETSTSSARPAAIPGISEKNETNPSLKSVTPPAVTGFRRWRSDFVTFLQGLWVGATMTVPGVSGGSMAIIIGCYDQLIASVSQIFKKPKASLRFLVVFLIGSGLGIVTISNVMAFLLSEKGVPMPTRFFFMGAVAGGIPLVFREAKISKLDWRPSGVARIIALVGLGLLIIWAISLIPKGLFAPSDGELGLAAVLIQLIGGIIVAAALVLPGISTSQMLLMLGLYEDIVARIRDCVHEFSPLPLIPLIPLAIGLLVGTFLISKALERLIERYPQATYMIILGFVLGSIPELFPGLPTGSDLPISIVTAIVGFGAIYFLSNLKKPPDMPPAAELPTIDSEKACP